MKPCAWTRRIRRHRTNLSAVGFNFSGLPLLILATVGVLNRGADGAHPAHRGGRSLPWRFFCCSRCPCFPFIACARKWLLAWQPGVRALPPEMQEYLARMWRRRWLPYSIGFFVMTVVCASGVAAVVGLMALLVNTLKAWITGQPL